MKTELYPDTPPPIADGKIHTIPAGWEISLEREAGEDYRGPWEWTAHKMGESLSAGNWPDLMNKCRKHDAEPS